MIKDALQWIVDSTKKPIFKEFDGVTFTDQKLHELAVPEYEASCLQLNTLASLIDFLKSNIDRKDCRYFVHVESERSVRVVSELTRHRNRETLLKAAAEIPYFEFGRYYGVEEFNIIMQSKFIDNKDREVLLAFTGNVVDEQVVNYGDDGVSQKATVKQGIVSKNEVIVPNPVLLIPYRTFVEVSQPESNFIFRVRKNHGIECAVFEADGGKWKLDAMQNIKNYLEKELDGIENLIIIA